MIYSNHLVAINAAIAELDPTMEVDTSNFNFTEEIRIGGHGLIIRLVVYLSQDGTIKN